MMTKASLHHMTLALAAVGASHDTINVKRPAVVHALRNAGAQIVSGNLSRKGRSTLLRALGVRVADVTNVQVEACVMHLRNAFTELRPIAPGNGASSDGTTRISDWTNLGPGRTPRKRSKPKGPRAYRKGSWAGWRDHTPTENTPPVRPAGL